MSLHLVKKLDEVGFLHADKHLSCKLISTFWVSKFPWWTWSSILKVLKVTHSQYFYDVSKKVRDEVHFLHADKNQSFYKLTLSFLMEVTRHVQSTQNRKFIIFFAISLVKILVIQFSLWRKTKNFLFIRLLVTNSLKADTTLLGKMEVKKN